MIISAWKLGAALATGNSVVLKPASQSPLTALRLAELAVEAGLPDGVLNVVTGPGAVIGDALARHPGVDKIAFTGSTEVGKSLLRAVGDSDVKAISLELGGKSPQLVLADVGDLEAAASAIGWGIFYNSGQTCNAGIAPRRPPVRPRGARRARRGARTEAGTRASRSTRRTRLGSIVDDRQLAKVLGYVDLGREEGATVVAGGERVREESGGYYIPPTILDGVANTMRVAREEIFGPVLTVTEFDDEDEAHGHRQRHAIRSRRRPVDARRQPRPPALAPDPRRHRLRQHLRHGRHHGARSGATSSRASGATRASTRSTATPSSRRPGSTSTGE